jgi:FMN-dependent NADH-azoreductase
MALPASIGRVCRPARRPGSDPAIQRVALSDRLIDELKTSDLPVIGAPMYNLNVPTGSEKWFDLVASPRANATPTSGLPGWSGVRAVVISFAEAYIAGRIPMPSYYRHYGLMGSAK